MMIVYAYENIWIDEVEKIIKVLLTEGGNNHFLTGGKNTNKYEFEHCIRLRPSYGQCCCTLVKSGLFMCGGDGGKREDGGAGASGSEQERVTLHCRRRRLTWLCAGARCY